MLALTLQTHDGIQIVVYGLGELAFVHVCTIAIAGTAVKGYIALAGKYILGYPVKMDYIQRLQTYAKRNAQMVKLRGTGLSFGKIAARFGISRARVEQIIKRASQ